MQLSRELDWVAKYRLLDGYRERDGLDWSDAKLRLIDLQYHDVRRDKGLYHRLVATGQVERLVSDEDVERAVMEPPEDTLHRMAAAHPLLRARPQHRDRRRDLA